VYGITLLNLMLFSKSHIYALMSSRRVADMPYVMCFRLHIAFNVRVIIHRYVPRLATEHEVNLSQFELFPTSSSF